MSRVKTIAIRLENLYKTHSRPSPYIKDGNDFRERLSKYTQGLINEAGSARERWKDLDEEAFKKKLSEKINSNPGGLATQKNALESNYRFMVKRQQDASDIHKQEGKADRAEKVRFLIFRLLTAIGIAAVVLATSSLAQYWGIRLPLQPFNAASIAARYSAMPNQCLEGCTNQLEGNAANQN